MEGARLCANRVSTGENEVTKVKNQSQDSPVSCRDLIRSKRMMARGKLKLRSTPTVRNKADDSTCNVMAIPCVHDGRETQDTHLDPTLSQPRHLLSERLHVPTPVSALALASVPPPAVLYSLASPSPKTTLSHRLRPSLHPLPAVPLTLLDPSLQLPLNTRPPIITGNSGSGTRPLQLGDALHLQLRLQPRIAHTLIFEFATTVTTEPEVPAVPTIMAVLVVDEDSRRRLTLDACMLRVCVCVKSYINV